MVILNLRQYSIFFRLKGLNWTFSEIQHGEPTSAEFSMFCSLFPLFYKERRGETRNGKHVPVPVCVLCVLFYIEKLGAREDFGQLDLLYAAF